MCLELGGVSGAEASGRVWALMYDISGAAPATLLQKLQADWEHVTNDLKFTEGAHHHRHRHRHHRHPATATATASAAAAAATAAANTANTANTSTRIVTLPGPEIRHRSDR